VLETKNYQGWIFGTEKQREWTQQIFRKRSRFQNPLRQNYKHIKTLQSLLDIAPEHLHSVIAFVGDCEFKTEMPAHVTRGLGFVGHIQSFTQPVWSPEQMQALLDKLEELRLQPGRATDRRHVAHVRQLQAASKARKPRLEPVAEAAAHLVSRPRPRPWMFCWSLSCRRRLRQRSIGICRRRCRPPSQPLRLLPGWLTLRQRLQSRCGPDGRCCAGLPAMRMAAAQVADAARAAGGAGHLALYQCGGLQLCAR
jgi:hypothetical protein